MNKEFIPYQEALALKELGFDEPCFAWYDGKYTSSINQDYCKNSKEWLTTIHCAAPLYQQAFRWFREKYNLFQYIEPSFDCIKLGYQNYSWLIKLRERVFIKDGTFKTYEEAELACLKKLIEIAKETK
jgi:hypothetical protein